MLPGPTIVIFAPIGQGREELVQQVAVGSVDLDDLGAGGQGAPRGGGEGVDDAGDPGGIQRLRRGVAVVEGDGARGDDVVPASVGGRDQLAALPG